MTMTKKAVEYFDTDFLGNKINIGDKVIFEAPKYRDFVIGTVITKAPKSCQIEYINDWNYSGGHKEVVRQYYGQVIKHTAADAESYGHWKLEVRSFYRDTWDESTELCVYIVAACNKCGEKHPNNHQVFSKTLYAPEDADDDFRFDQEKEKAIALEEFLLRDYKFANFCPNCGAHMEADVHEE